MTSEEGSPRLSVVAAIIDDPDDRPLGPAARSGSRYREPSAASATPKERELAQALQGDGQPSGQDEPAMAELLMLAAQIPQAEELATGLSEAYLLPDDSRLTCAREERRSAFVELYRRLALHQLSSQVRNRAAAVLARLGRS
jgi:hypothetical protein